MKTTLAIVVVIAAALAAAPPCRAADGPLATRFVQLEYGADSTVQLYGGSFDSDTAVALQARVPLAGRWFAFGRWFRSDYDLSGRDDLGLEEYSLGVGYWLPVRRGAGFPIDAYAVLSYDAITTRIETELEQADLDDSGMGLRLGLRATPTAGFEVGAEIAEHAYGSNPVSRSGPVDGLFFTFDAALELSRRFALTLAYTTGELDYKDLPGFVDRVEVEVDRDELMVGVRFAF